MKKTAIPVSVMLDLAPSLIPCSGLTGGSTVPRTLFNLRPVTAFDGKEDAFVPVGDSVASPLLADMRPLGSISPENDGIKRTVFKGGAVLRAALEDGSALIQGPECASEPFCAVESPRGDLLVMGADGCRRLTPRLELEDTSPQYPAVHLLAESAGTVQATVRERTLSKA